VLVGTVDGQHSWIAFDCPCGRRHRIVLNLSPMRRPRWRVTVEAPLTIVPSIDSAEGRTRCHYWIRDGRVQWVPESS
jgi:Family of unknown function (DUF6527)